MGRKSLEYSNASTGLAMSKIISRLDRIEKMEREGIIKLRSDAEKGALNSVANLWALSLRNLAIIDFVKKNDVIAFRSQMREASLLKLGLFDRFDKGEKVAASYVSLLSYKFLFMALAAGDLDLAKKLASKIGGRPVDCEDRLSRFDITFGSALKFFVLDDKELMEVWAKKLAELHPAETISGLSGYIEVFQNYLNNNQQGVVAGFSEIIKGHKKLSVGKNIFANTMDELVCVWGLGMMNLLRARGYKIQSNDSLIPEILVV